MTHREHAHGAIFATGHARANGEPLDRRALLTAAAQGLTLVVYMGVTSIEALHPGLLHSLPARAPAGVVQHASLPRQRQLTCTFGTLAASVRTLPQTGAGKHATGVARHTRTA